MISIHQSQFLPWVPYFYKVLKSDIFVVLDNVQFQKNGVQNRNMIKTPQGAKWLTVPVRFELGTPIDKVEVENINIYPKLLKTLEMNYKQSSFFSDVYAFINNVFSKRLGNLHALNMELFKGILDMMKVKDDIYFSSDMQAGGKKDDLLIEIIKNFNESEYLSGKGALNYMDLDKFKKAGIKVYVYEFSYQKYGQLWDKKLGFIPDLSIVDLFFNNLENSTQYILSNGSIKNIA